MADKKFKDTYLGNIGKVWTWITSIWVISLLIVTITWFVATLQWDNSVGVVWSWVIGDGAALVRVVLFLAYVISATISFFETKAKHRGRNRSSW